MRMMYAPPHLAMDIKCTNLDCSIGLDGRMRLSLAVSPSSADTVRAQFDRLVGHALAVKITRDEKKRSLGANALMWKCLGGLADRLNDGISGIGISTWDLYLEMIERYGVFDFIVVKPQAVDFAKRQFRVCKDFGRVHVGKQEGVQLQCWPGSSTYDVPQMTRLLNGVIAECRDAGAWVPDEQDIGYSLDIWRRECELQKQTGKSL